MAANTVSGTMDEKTPWPQGADVVSVGEKEHAASDRQVEEVDKDDGNLHYDEVDVEPELHMRTYIALAAMFMLNMVQVVALQGPPAVVSRQTRGNVILGGRI
jgi:hypothetical protein